MRTTKTWKYERVELETLLKSQNEQWSIWQKWKKMESQTNALFMSLKGIAMKILVTIPEDKHHAMVVLTKIPTFTYF